MSERPALITWPDRHRRWLTPRMILCHHLLPIGITRSRESTVHSQADKCSNSIRYIGMNFSGGLNYIDLKSSVGAVVRTVAARRAEGVFSVRAEFTSCGRYVLFYHSKRRTLREETVTKVLVMHAHFPQVRLKILTCILKFPISLEFFHTLLHSNHAECSESPTGRCCPTSVSAATPPTLRWTRMARRSWWAALTAPSPFSSWRTTQRRMQGGRERDSP